MKRLNFAKWKKQLKLFLKNLFGTNKKKVAIQQKVLTDIKENMAGRYKRRGTNSYRAFTHILKPLNKRFTTVYWSFNKQQLPYKIIIIGNKIYRVELNPFYKNRYA